MGANPGIFGEENQDPQIQIFAAAHLNPVSQTWITKTLAEIRGYLWWRLNYIEPPPHFHRNFCHGYLKNWLW
ncbi:hypothetical protein FYZ41_10285 [Mobiluncus mulieris]|nr:hypothetical protein [Mobiluncus mulieris]